MRRTITSELVELSLARLIAIMKLGKTKFLYVVLVTCLSIGWCELGYYYFTFYFLCQGWPQVPSGASGHSNLTNILVLADTHIMGPRWSNKIDKLRREWEMKQAFRISASVFKPDLIIFMGDIFDEGFFSTNQIFEQTHKDYEDIFGQYLVGQDNLMIAGNHDVGYHDRVLSFPFIMQRFSETFDTTNDIDLIKYATRKQKSEGGDKLNLVVSNSMTFFNDSCPYCRRSLAKTEAIASALDTRPILLTHIPLYRQNDSLCEHPSSLDNFVNIENIEGHDVLHKRASKVLLEKLKPMLVISGHTHLKCITKHRVTTENEHQYEEITVSSYNHKYANAEPGFLLLSANSTNYYTSHCKQVQEFVIGLVYVISLVFIAVIIVWPTRNKLSESKGKLILEVDD